MSSNIPQASQEVIGTGVKEKLANLQQYMPDQEPIVYDFARFLSERANDQLVPTGFNLLAELALYDLRMGIDGFTGKPIQGCMSEYPPMRCTTLDVYLPGIAKAIFGEAYSDQLVDIREQVSKSLKKLDV